MTKPCMQREESSTGKTNIKARTDLAHLKTNKETMWQEKSEQEGMKGEGGAHFVGPESPL